MFFVFDMGMSDSALLETPATSNANANSGAESTEKSAGGKAFEAMVSGNDPGDEVDSSNETNETAIDSTGEENNAAESAEHGGEADAADDSNAESDPLAGLSEGIASIKAMLAPETKQETHSHGATPTTQTESKPGEPDELDKFAVEQWGEDSDTTKNFTKAVDARVNRIVKAVLDPVLKEIAPHIQYVHGERVSKAEQTARNATYSAIDATVKATPALASLYGADQKVATPEQQKLRSAVYTQAIELAKAFSAIGKKFTDAELLKSAELLVRADNAGKIVNARQHGSRLAALDTRKSESNPSQVPQKRVGTSSGAALFEKMKRQ